MDVRLILSNLSTGTEHMRMIFTVAGLIGFLIVTVLSVSASKAIMTYYERLRLKVFYQWKNSQLKKKKKKMNSKHVTRLLFFPQQRSWILTTLQRLYKSWVPMIAAAHFLCCNQWGASYRTKNKLGAPDVKTIRCAVGHTSIFMGPEHKCAVVLVPGQ